MKRIKKLVKMIDEELCSAEHYAEKSIEYKIDGSEDLSRKFSKMASEELEHAMVLHEVAVKEIDKASQYVSVPAEMREKWEISHQEYIDKVAKIKSYISMS